MSVRYVEETYKLDIGNAQITQLSKAITSGADKGVFVLPKGKPLLDFTASPQMFTLRSQDLPDELNLRLRSSLLRIPLPRR